jgi:tetratricopeptide (TPR) repeat protein
MQALSFPKYFLLGIALMAAGAAGEAESRSRNVVAPAPQQSHRPGITGAFGAYLEGQFAMSEADPDTAAADFLKALAADPGNRDLLQQAFLATVLAGRPEAGRLARELPDDQSARLVLADLDVKAGNWDSAEQRFRALPKQGLTQILQPLLVAWAQQGGGRTEAALNTLRPYVEGQRFRGVYALHAALIADLSGRNAEAARLYHTAQTEYGGVNLRLAQVLASWQARQGHQAEAEATLRSLSEGADEMSIAVPAMIAVDATRPVAHASDGIAEAYLALAAALRTQEASDFSLLLLRLALDSRPDFTAARLLLADIMDSNKHWHSALAVLAPVGASDPLSAVVQLRRAAFTEHLGRTEEAMRELETLAQEYPASPLPLAQEGDVLRSKNRFADAVQAYDRAIARVQTPSRNVWPLFYSRGIAEERSHQWPRAEADLKRALELAPEQPFVLNYLAYSWADQGRHLAEAKQMLERAVEERPNDGAIIDSLGWVLLREGDTADAIKSLEHAAELEPEDPTINGHLGDAYWAAGRKREAQFQWRRALVMNPDPEEATQLETKLHDASAQAEGATTAEHRLQ